MDYLTLKLIASTIILAGAVIYFYITNAELRKEITKLKSNKAFSMSRLDRLLSKLSEEAIEVAKEALKAQQFGLNNATHEFTSNRQRLVNELDDFNAIVEMLNEEFGLEYEPDPTAIQLKKEKVNSYISISEALSQK